MNKKEYIKPEIEVMEMAVETPMLTASLGFEDRDVNTEEDQLGTGRRPSRRGKWGNLWYTED